MHDFRGLDAGGAMKRFLSAKDQARHDVFFLVVDKRPSIVEGERWTIDRYSHGQGGEDTRC